MENFEKEIENNALFLLENKITLKSNATLVAEIKLH